jgi:excisionase family DNA binding protein
VTGPYAGTVQAASSQDGATPYTLHEAAQLLGVSLNTVRRKIARGELKATRSPRPQGHVWHVWLQPVQGSAQHPTQGSTQHPPTEQVQDAASMLPVDRADQLARALVPLVEAAVAPIRAELAEVRAMLGTRDQELGAAQERIRTLEAALAASTSPDAPQRATEAVPAEPAQQSTDRRRPWWRRWLPA